MRRSGHRDRTDISGSKIRRAAITPARKCTDGVGPSQAVLRTAPANRTMRTKNNEHALFQRTEREMDSVRVERTPADFQSAATTESAYCPDHPSGI